MIIELGTERRFFHRDWAWMSLDWANIDEKMKRTQTSAVISLIDVELKIRSRLALHEPSLSSEGEARNSLKYWLFNKFEGEIKEFNQRQSIGGDSWRLSLKGKRKSGA